MYYSNASAAAAAMRFRMAPAAMQLVMSSARAVGRWWVQRRDIEHLQALPDHMLKDIGLHRSQIISAVVHGPENFPRSRD